MQIIVIWKLLIDFRVCSPWNLINIRNGKYRKFVLCLYKGIGADSWKPHRDNYFLTLANGNLFLLRHVEISSVLLFSKVSGSAQMMDFLGGNHRLHCLNHIGMLRPFCGFPMIDCYQDHGLFKVPHMFWWPSLIHAFTVSERFCVIVIPCFIWDIYSGKKLGRKVCLFLSTSSATGNLHIISKTFTLTYPNIDKSEYKTHLRYIVIIERFQKRKYNANAIMQLMKYWFWNKSSVLSIVKLM